MRPQEPAQGRTDPPEYEPEEDTAPLPDEHAAEQGCTDEYGY